MTYYYYPREMTVENSTHCPTTFNGNTRDIILLYTYYYIRLYDVRITRGFVFVSTGARITINGLR